MVVSQGIAVTTLKLKCKIYECASSSKRIETENKNKNKTKTRKNKALEENKYNHIKRKLEEGLTRRQMNPWTDRHIYIHNST